MKIGKSILKSLVLGVFALTLVGCNAEAESEYPTDDIRWIMPVSSGGGFDTTSRQIQQYLEEELGTNTVIENHPGGSNAIGSTLVAGAEPDGYTMMTIGSPHLHFSYWIQETEYDFEDFEPIAGITKEPGVIRVANDAPWEDLNELIEYAKEQPPGTITASVSNLASGNFLGLKQLEEATGVEFNIVGYGGGNEARTAVLQGEVDLTHAGVFNSLSIADGTKVIGVQSETNDWPDLTDNAQTFNEQLGGDIPHNVSTYGIWAPAGLKEENPENYETLVEAVKNTLENPELQEAMEELGEWEKFEYIAPEEYQEQQMEEIETLKRYEDIFMEEAE